MANKINPRLIQKANEWGNDKIPEDRPITPRVAIPSLEQLVDFAGVKIQREDRDALQEIYRSAGKNPEDYYSPNNDGKIRIENNRIIYLDANSIQLTSLPDRIGDLKALQELYVSDNKLTNKSMKIIKILKGKGVLVSE